MIIVRTYAAGVDRVLGHVVKRRHPEADGFSYDDGALHLYGDDGQPVAVYASGEWLSARKDA